MPAKTAASQQTVDDQRFREDMGFRSDLAYIDSLSVRADAGPREAAGLTTAWGAIMTRAEARDMALRQAIQDDVASPPLNADGRPARAPSAFSSYLASHRDEFAGDFIDQHADGAVTVLFTGHVAEHAAALAARFPFAGHLLVRAARYTYAELLDGTSVIARQASALSRAGTPITEVGPDIRANMVRIGVAYDNPAVERRLRGLFGQLPIEIKVAQPSSPTGQQGTNAPPVRAGQSIYRSAGGTNFVGCTSAFVVNGPSGFYVATAGHCGSSGSKWIQGPFIPCCSGSYVDGSMTASIFGDVDVAVIHLLNQGDKSHDILLSFSSCGLFGLETCNNIWLTQGQENFPTSGEVTCFSGSVSGGEKCGNLIAIDQCVTYSGGPTVCHQEFANFPDMHGDSGGPYYQPQSSGTSLALGIASGTNLTTQSNYTQITSALSGLANGGFGSYSVYSG